MPRISSTSFITGTGFMKCMPMKRSGRSVPAARRVIEIDEVLVAISASGGRCRIEPLEDLALDRLVLGRRLDHQVAVARTARSRCRCAIRASAAPALVLAERRLLRRAGARWLSIRSSAPSSCSWLRSSEAHLEAGERADMGDAAAHLAGADHADAADLGHRRQVFGTVVGMARQSRGTGRLSRACGARPSSSGTALNRSPTRP